jgi:hypothetical protein
VIDGCVVRWTVRRYGYPAVVALSPKKGVFVTMKTALETGHLKTWIESLRKVLLRALPAWIDCGLWVFLVNPNLYPKTLVFCDGIGRREDGAHQWRARGVEPGGGVGRARRRGV